MKTFNGDLFDQQMNGADAIVITTNGFVKKNGKAVMGRGVAETISKLMPLVPVLLGEKLLSEGNHVHDLGMSYNCGQLVSFPVKPEKTICERGCLNVVKHMRWSFKYGDEVPGWAAVASLDLIVQSLKELVELTNKKEWKRVVLPLPGCGAGELMEEDILPILQKELDDRFILVRKKAI
jgi:hypothetical protein